MKRSPMSRAWLLPACIVALAALPAGGSQAQGQPQQSQSQYQGLGDSPETPSTLDKDYGLSFFGAPGSEGPNKTTAPAKDPSQTSEFFPGSTEIRLPKRPTVSPSESDTPLYTTTEGSETGGSPSATGETPLFDDGSDSAGGGAKPAVTGTPR
jgi:hypothetical protein